MVWYWKIRLTAVSLRHRSPAGWSSVCNANGPQSTRPARRWPSNEQHRSPPLSHWYSNRWKTAKRIAVRRYVTLQVLFVRTLGNKVNKSANWWISREMSRLRVYLHYVVLWCRSPLSEPYGAGERVPRCWRTCEGQRCAFDLPLAFTQNPSSANLKGAGKMDW